MSIDFICCSHTYAHTRKVAHNAVQCFKFIEKMPYNHCEVSLILCLVLVMIPAVISTRVCAASIGNVHYPSTYWNLLEEY